MSMVRSHRLLSSLNQCIISTKNLNVENKIIVRMCMRWTSLTFSTRIFPYDHDSVRFVVTPKPADVGEHLKPNTRPYHQEWLLVDLFYISRGAVIPCGGCINTPTPRLQLSSGELNLKPMLWYHVRFVVTPKPADVGEHLKPITSPITRSGS